MSEKKNIYMSKPPVDQLLAPQRPLSVDEGRAWSASLSVKVVPGRCTSVGHEPAQHLHGQGGSDGSECAASHPRRAAKDAAD